jgi:DNA-binding IclR family transcriptional regulator
MRKSPPAAGAGPSVSLKIGRSLEAHATGSGVVALVGLVGMLPAAALVAAGVG